MSGKTKKQKAENCTEFRALEIDDWCLLFGAMRYFMNRETIAASSFPAIIVKKYWYRLSHAQKAMLLDDLKKHYDERGQFGHQTIDSPHWEKLMAALNETSHFFVRGIDNVLYLVFQIASSPDKFYSLTEYLRAPESEKYIPRENVKGVILNRQLVENGEIR